MQRVRQLLSCLTAGVLMVAAVAAALVSASPAMADGPSYAVRAGRIILGSSMGDGAGIENGVLIVRDGRIERVGGPDLPIPDDLAILDLPGQTIMPGLIAANTQLAGAHAGEHAVSGLYSAIDAYDVYADLRPWLAAGVTAVHLNPGDHRLVSGLGGVVRLGGDPDKRIIVPRSDIQVNFTPRAMRAPAILRLLLPPAADGMIQPPLRQPGLSRLDMRAALDHFIERGRQGLRDDGEYSAHLDAFAKVWDSNTPMRVRADRAADIAHAITLIREQTRRRSTLVGAAEAGGFVDAIGSMRLGVVYELDGPAFGVASDQGLNPDPLERSLDTLAALAADTRIPLAIAPASGDPRLLRLSVASAKAAGIADARLIGAMTGDAARILGVDDRIGILTPGREADFIVFNGHPLDGSASVRRVYIGGKLVFEHPSSGALVVRGGTVWLGPDQSIENGSVLIEDGSITAVGRSVPVPPGARVIDAGPGTFITPGFIDGHGHLLFGGNSVAPPPSFEAERMIGAADGDAMRLAHAGVTTVVNAPRRIHNNGSRLVAVKTAGLDRESRLVTPIAAIAFDLRSGHPETFERRIKPRIESGKRYAERWQKYYQDIAAWEKARLEGTDFTVSKDEDDSAAPTQAADDDPVSGTWMMTVKSDVFPEPISGRVALTLTGDQVEGRVIEPAAAEVDHKIVGTFDGRTVSGRIEVDTGGAGQLTFTMTIANDSARGSVDLAELGVSFELEGERISREMTSFKVVRKRSTTGRDGRPLPPPVDETEEPWRAVFENGAPVAVYVNTPEGIAKALDILDQFKIKAVLIGPERATLAVDRIARSEATVIAPASLIQRDIRRSEPFGEYSPLLDLARKGLRFGMQSGAADGAASLPSVGLAAVSLGLAPDQMLAALTVDAAKAYRLDNRVGVLGPGRDGDVLVFSGHPFEPGSKLLRVIVDGKEIAR